MNSETLEKVMVLDIVTPSRLAFSGEVTQLSAPGADGSFTILFRHADFVSALKVGIIKLITSEGLVQFFAISGGFLEVSHNKLTLLAETAERAEEIDRDRAAAAKKRAEERLRESQSENDMIRAQSALYRALNRLKVSEFSN